MRRLGTGLGAVALLGVAVTAALADDVLSDGQDGPQPKYAADRPGSTSWNTLFGPSDKDKGRNAAPAGQPMPAPTAPPVADRAASIQQREEKAFMRRMAVCDRLRQIAEATNDADLGRQADALQEQAWLIYTRRTASLGLPGTDEAVLQQRLGTGTATPRPRAGAPAGDGRAELPGEGRR